MLHNLCELQNEVFHSDWLNGVDQTEVDRDDDSVSEGHGDGHVIRNAFARNFCFVKSLKFVTYSIKAECNL